METAVDSGGGSDRQRKQPEVEVVAAKRDGGSGSSCDNGGSG